MSNDNLPELLWEFSFSPWPEDIETVEAAKKEGYAYSDSILLVPVAEEDGQYTMGMLGISLGDDPDKIAMKDEEFYRIWIGMAILLARKTGLSMERRKLCAEIINKEPELARSISTVIREIEQ